ncbi:MAG TPA: AgmX/PglI C-terminal domain-containing protein [Kofleriaceae bacterium]|nr:AgmX/PglI C-terminal domain-containing protein [Kofleriaceae bacterium]
MKSLSFLVVTLIACAGTQEETVKPPPSQTPTMAPPKKTTSGDVSFEVPVIDIKGTVLEPDAIARPGMPLVDAKRPIPLDKIGSPEWQRAVAKQRTQVASTKDPVQKQAQAAVLATMLYRESKATKDKDKEKALLTDARQVLREVAQQAGDKAVDEITLRMLGSYELEPQLADYPAAETAWRTLIEKDPKSKELTYNRAWLAYAQLKQFKNADALATVSADKVDDKQPELAYVTAWAKWRARDNAAAWQAISAAAKGWGQNANRDELEANVLMFAGRAGVPLDQALPVLTMIAKDKAAAVKQTKHEQMLYELVAKLGLSGYGLVGRWADGVAALDKAASISGDAVPVNDRVVIRYSQADFTVRLDAPDAAAAFAKQAIEAIGPCGNKCTEKDKADIVQGIYLMGRLFHILFATANDHRYYEPARDLYGLTIPLLSDASLKTQAQKDAKVLETTVKNIKVGTGTHDKGALGALLARHTPEIQACYEAVLGTNPKLGGTIKLDLESDETGAIKGAASEPKAGASELPAVAECIVEHARQWKLPRRGMAGKTRIHASFSFSVAKRP